MRRWSTAPPERRRGRSGHSDLLSRDRSRLAGRKPSRRDARDPRAGRRAAKPGCPLRWQGGRWSRNQPRTRARELDCKCGRLLRRVRGRNDRESRRRVNRSAAEPPGWQSSGVLAGRALARVRHERQHLADRYSAKQRAGANHPPAGAGAGSGLGGRQPSDASRWTRNWMKPGPSTSTPTWAFGSSPVRFQRST